MVDTSDEWIRTRTGIVERHVADPAMATSDMAVQAARRALEDAGVVAADLDFVLVATATPDTMFPSTGSLVQHQIGATRAGACDITCGCSGWVYGISMMSQCIASGLYRKVLVVGADTLTRLVDWSDRGTCVLFGDGAGAVVLEADTSGKGMLSCVLGSDGAGADLLRLPAGGSRLPASAQTVAEGQHYIHMAGNEVFKFAVKTVSEIALEALQRAGLSVADVDLFVPHQANLRIIDAAAKRLGIREDRLFVNVDRYGNTSCASIPIALSEAQDQRRLAPGHLVLVCGFGAGLSWGCSVMRWSHARARSGAPGNGNGKLSSVVTPG